MAGVYGNDNLSFATKSQFVTVDGTPDLSAELSKGTIAVSLYTTSACWWNFTEVGKDTPAAAIPGAEKTVVESKFLPASTWLDFPVPDMTDENKIKVAVVEATGGSGGVLYITERNDANG